MARPVEQVVAEQRPDVAEDLGVARGVQAVAAVVHGLAGELEAAGVAAHGALRSITVTPDAASPGEPVGRAEAGRAGAQDDHVGGRGGAHTTKGMKRLVRAQYAR